MNTNSAWNIKLHKSESKLKSTRKCQDYLLAQLDKYTRAHSQRVQKLAQKLGEILHLNRDDINHLSTAALFHDIGKIAVNLGILFKNKGLTRKEQKQMHRQPSSLDETLKTIQQASGKQFDPFLISSIHKNFEGNGFFSLYGELWRPQTKPVVGI